MDSHEQKLTWLASFSHFITHGYMSLLPAVLVVITAEQSISFTDIGIIANVGYFLYGLGAFPAGYLADKYGSKRLLTIGLFGMAVSSMLIGLSQGLVSFTLTYALLGVFASIHHPAGLSLIARRVESRKGKALGIHGVMGNVGLFMTPMVAALGVKLFRSWRAAYLVYGVIGLLFALYFHFSRIKHEEDLKLTDLLGNPLRLLMGSAVKPPPNQMAQAPEAGEGNPSSIIPVSLLLLFAGSILSGFIFRGSLTFFPKLLQQEIHFISSSDEPVFLAGTITTAILSLGLIGSWFGGYINDKIKTPEYFPIFIFLVVAPSLYFIGSYSNTPLLVMGALFSLVYYAWQPSHNYLISKYTRKTSHGMGFGVNFFLIFGIGSVATAIGGYVTDDYGVDRFYLVMSVFAVAALAAAVGVYLVRPLLIRFSWQMIREKDS
ncbi:MAG: MFS transporter [Proteobacteria bacterium]|nr:MFS transporter [Pseudomonadota bacterium]MBU1686524.1 MFS transporter [Pseudomonadota bacterium]